MAMEELKPSEKKTLQDLRLMLEQSIKKNHLLNQNNRSNSLKSFSSNSTSLENNKIISLWGVPLLLSNCSSDSNYHDCLDTILLKFLRAREFKLSEAFEMIQRTLKWRNDFGAEGILREQCVDSECFEGTAYMDGFDREGRPVCYNVYGQLREGSFGGREKQESFLRWRVQFMERGIQDFVSFGNGGAAATMMVQVIDLKDLMGSSMKELRSTIEKMIKIFQDNYPDFIFKHIFLNVSLRYYTYRALFSPLLTTKTESKIVFARPCKVTETLLRYISPQNIPIQYGGFKRKDDDIFLAEDQKVSETCVKGGNIAFVEIPIAKAGVTVVWDIIIVGWEVLYKEEFIPEDEGSYKILIKVDQKKTGPPTRNSFYIHEPGKLVFTIENKASKMKSIFYRYKSNPTIPCYRAINHPLKTC